HGNLSQTFSSAAAIYNVNTLINKVDNMNPHNLYFGTTINTLNLAVLKVNKESTIIFKHDGTWESYENRDIINELKNSDFMLQCNRWIWINKFFIKGIVKKGNQEYITLKDDLEEKYKHIKSFNEGYTSNRNKRQSYLFISRNFKDSVHQELKNYK